MLFDMTKTIVYDNNELSFEKVNDDKCNNGVLKLAEESISGEQNVQQ